MARIRKAKFTDVAADNLIPCTKNDVFVGAKLIIQSTGDLCVIRRIEDGLYFADRPNVGRHFISNSIKSFCKIKRGRK